MMALAACGEEETSTRAGAAPSASAGPSSAPPAPAGTTSDKELCESAKKAGEEIE